jgi:hypothetical protein
VFYTFAHDKQEEKLQGTTAKKMRKSDFIPFGRLYLWMSILWTVLFATEALAEFLHVPCIACGYSGLGMIASVMFIFAFSKWRSLRLSQCIHKDFYFGGMGIIQTMEKYHAVSGNTFPLLHEFKNFKFALLFWLKLIEFFVFTGCAVMGTVLYRGVAMLIYGAQ